MLGFIDPNRWRDWLERRGGEPSQEPPHIPTPPRWLKWVLIALAVVATIVVGLYLAKGIYTEWLWFQSQGYSTVYGTIIKTKVVMFFIGAVLFLVLFLGNLALARRLAPKAGMALLPVQAVNILRRLGKLGVALGAALLGLIFGMVAMGKWEAVLRYINGQPFAATDPVFHKEISFYLFSLPLYHSIQGWFVGALIVTFLACLALYFVSHGAQQLAFAFSRPVKAHLSLLVAAILGLFAWRYVLDIWGLVYSERGVVFGASYADMNAKLPVNWMLVGIVSICVFLLIANIFRRGYRLPLYGLAAWLILHIVAGSIYPAIIQRFQVQPNELARETQYIEYNIAFTRQAFALDRIEEQPFPAEEILSEEDIAKNSATINNIRLWDPRPLKDTYNQKQAIRLYYGFYDVDIDRYTLDGQYRQVMLGARELWQEKLDPKAQTWVNQRLVFTHGYGLTLSPVNEVDASGLPLLLVKDIPPVGEIEIERPQVYYGEKTEGYVIVNSNTPEFDYPMGEINVETEYAGSGGVNLGSFWRRFAYAWHFGDINVLISGELTPQSRVLYYRNISQRVKHLAPFLEVDADPYLVIADGKLVWIQDAYTVSDRYPYSEPLTGGINYIRNSVKAVVDAYDGTVTLYVMEPDDPLVRTYQAIFPHLFTPVEEMPQTIRAHLRYPEAMFQAQATRYLVYHMQDPRVFYNKEDQWLTPSEVYSESEQSMEPYYIIMSLPGEEREEFLLMLPFTPAGKKNTIAWLAARCDGENYGKLLAYHFPKDKLVYGPMQIENLIVQDPKITEQLALWKRGGARVIRGNLLMLPIEKSYLYVEPVFLQATEGGLPALKAVIVARGDNIAMGETLEESLAAVFGAAPPAPPTPTPTPPEEPIPAEVAALAQSIQQHWEKAMQEYAAGNWTAYAAELEALDEEIAQLQDLISKWMEGE